MRAARVGLVLVVFAAVLGAATPAQAVEPATVSGVVTGTDGQPIEGVTVRQTENSGPIVVTDVDGAYSFTFFEAEEEEVEVEPLEVAFSFTAPGYVPRCHPQSGSSCDVMFVQPGDAVTVDITLLQAASISGTLTDPNGDPVAATVSAYDVAVPNNRPDASGVGSYSLANLVPGRYVVKGSTYFDNPLAAEAWEDAYDFDDATVIDVEEGEDVVGIDLTFEVGAVVTGRVTDHAGDPVPFTTVQADRTDDVISGNGGGRWYVNSTTDADGYFTILGLSPGGYFVSADPFSFRRAFHPSSGSYVGSTALTVGLGDVVSNIDIEMLVPGTSEVRIINADGTRAGAGATFAMCPPGTELVDDGAITCSGAPLIDQATADAGGYASLFAVPAGSYQMGAIVDGDLYTDDFATTLGTNDVFDCYITLGESALDDGVFCAVSPDAPPPVTDEDGVPDAVEDGAPNGGDGNGDGIADSQQAEVTSLPAAIGTGHVTIAAPDGTTLQAVTVTAPPGSPPLPPGASLDAGVISYTLADVPVGGAVDIDVHLSGGTTANGYLKLQGGAWVELPPSAFDIAGNVITLHLVDGGVGDEDGVANGVIVDPGAPASLDQTPPTITCPTPPKPLFKATGATLTASVTDGGSGPLAATVTVPLVTTSAGVRTVSVSASDNAGNVATTSCSYQVVYRVQWVVPIGGPSRYAAASGQVVPLTFRLVDAQGNGVTGSVVTAPTSVATACPAGSYPKVVTVKGTAVTGTVGGGLWLAGWKAEKAWKGTCRLVTIALADGTAPTLVIKVV